MPPGQDERLRAIGSTNELPATLRRALDPGSEFEQISIPKSNDWLAENSEPGQTFDDFVIKEWDRPNKICNVICLQPLGELPEDQSPSLEILKEYVSKYFMMKVEILAPLHLNRQAFATRDNRYTKKPQILTTDILSVLGKMLIIDSYCILAITMEDLYPGPSMNFVFGEADLRKRVGVQSFARYDPTFYKKERMSNYQRILLERSCKIVVHEIAHMFGLKHCIFFKCILNGFNHLEEVDVAPLHLCPACLRKLQFSIGFDVVERYCDLLPFYQKVGFNIETQWVINRLQKISEPE